MSEAADGRRDDISLKNWWFICHPDILPFPGLAFYSFFVFPPFFSFPSRPRSSSPLLLVSPLLILLFFPTYGSSSDPSPAMPLAKATKVHPVQKFKCTRGQAAPAGPCSESWERREGQWRLRRWLHCFSNDVIRTYVDLLSACSGKLFIAVSIYFFLHRISPSSSSTPTSQSGNSLEHDRWHGAAMDGWGVAWHTQGSLVAWLGEVRLN